MEIFHLHPAVVHFPIAFLLASLVVGIASMLRKDPPGLQAVASTLLWAGTGALWLSVVMGLLAERSAPHVPAAWEILFEHRRLGFWAAGVFTLLSLWQAVRPRTLRSGKLALWLVAVALLVLTAYHGAQLVFHFGMGVIGHETD